MDYELICSNISVPKIHVTGILWEAYISSSSLLFPSLDGRGLRGSRLGVTHPDPLPPGERENKEENDYWRAVAAAIGR